MIEIAAPQPIDDIDGSRSQNQGVAVYVPGFVVELAPVAFERHLLESNIHQEIQAERPADRVHRDLLLERERLIQELDSIEGEFRLQRAVAGRIEDREVF